MAATDELQLTKDAWVEVPLAGNYLAIQLNEAGAIKVHVADAAPLDANETGIYIARNQTGVPGSFALGGIPDGVHVYARSARDEAETIVYLTY